MQRGGEGGIRTPGTLAGTPDFESGAFDQALPPLRVRVRPEEAANLSQGPRKSRPQARPLRSRAQRAVGERRSSDLRETPAAPRGCRVRTRDRCPPPSPSRRCRCVRAVRRRACWCRSCRARTAARRGVRWRGCASRTDSGGADGLRVMADRRGAVVAEGVVPARSFGERVHFAQVIESQARGEVHQVLLNHGPIRPGDACHAKI